MNYDSILKSISDRMNDKSITSYRLAKLSGLSESGLSLIFNHKRQMSLEVFLKICNALELQIEIKDGVIK